MTEQDIQNSIRLKLSEMGYYVERTNVGKISTDLKAYKDGKAYFLEVKTPTGKVRQEQENFIKQMQERYHMPAAIVRSVEEAVEFVSS